MRVFVDQIKCNTAGICVKELPEIFQFNAGNKKARAILNPVPVDYQKRLLEVLPKCPVGAITVEFDTLDSMEK